MACIAPVAICNDSNETLLEYKSSSCSLECWDTSSSLKTLANQLQFYKPPIFSDESENGYYNMGPKIGREDDGVVSFVSSTPREKRAAVLICIFEGCEGELRVILTKRSMKLSSHPGEVALPGGKMDEGDSDDSATALREAMEEIGLNPCLVQVVANLEPFISQHLLTVVPVVALLPRPRDFKPVLNADEVDAIFDVPLEMFLKEENHREEEREWEGWHYMCHIFDFKSEQGEFMVGGLTASILIRAATITYLRPPPLITNKHLPDFQCLQRSLKHRIM